MKPIVKYDASKGAYIVVGAGALVNPIDHPSELVSNTKTVITSRVIEHDMETGEFETQNTRYVPATRNQCDGCQAGLPLNAHGHHYNPEADYHNAFSCTKERY